MKRANAVRPYGLQTHRIYLCPGKFQLKDDIFPGVVRGEIPRTPGQAAKAVFKGCAVPVEGGAVPMAKARDRRAVRGEERSGHPAALGVGVEEDLFFLYPDGSGAKGGSGVPGNPGGKTVPAENCAADGKGGVVVRMVAAGGAVVEKHFASRNDGLGNLGYHAAVELSRRATGNDIPSPGTVPVHTVGAEGKLLVSAALICLTALGFIPAWMTIVIISREFIISGFRLIAAERGIVIAAGWLGKWKTAVTMVMLAMMLLGVNSIGFPFDPTVTMGVYGVYMLITEILLWISVVLTVVSLVDYLVKNKNVMKDEV